MSHQKNCICICVLLTEHTINNGEASPSKVRPRAIPFHLTEKVHQQLQEVIKRALYNQVSAPDVPLQCTFHNHQEKLEYMWIICN